MHSIGTAVVNIHLMQGFRIISPTECNSDTSQNCPFRVNTTVELRTITTTNEDNHKQYLINVSALKIIFKKKY